jgi:hypothetical protein
VFLRVKKLNGKKLLRIDALLLLNYKKPLEVKKHTKEMDFKIMELLLPFGPPCHALTLHQIRARS